MEKECAITHLGRSLLFQRLELDRVRITNAGVRPYSYRFRDFLGLKDFQWLQRATKMGFEGYPRLFMAQSLLLHISRSFVALDYQMVAVG